MKEIIRSLYFFIEKYAYLFIFSFIFIVFYVLNYTNIHLQVYPYRDLAADMLLSNKIYNDILLTGHYSRFGFNHPGSFFFYINAFFEKILSPFSDSRFTAWLFGSIVINSIFLTISVKLFLVMLNVKNSILFYGILLSVVLLAFLSNTIAHSIHPYLWMPGRILIPYLIFLLTLPLIMQRKYSYLPLSMFFAGVLIHGYVVLPLMTLPILGFAFLFANKRPFTKKEQQYIYLTLVIGILFVFPMLYDLMENDHQSNIYKILSVLGTPHTHSTWQETFIFIKSFFLFPYSYTLLVLLVIAGFTFFYNNNETKKYFVLLFIANMLVSLIFFFYYHSAPKPLFHFMGKYYFAVPISIYTFSIIMIFTAERLKYLIVIQTFCVLLTFYLSWQLMTTPKLTKQNLHIIKLVEAIKKNTNNDQAAYITFDQHQVVHTLTGIILELNREKYFSCTTRMDLGIFSNTGATCKIDIFPNIKFVKKDQCNNRCVYKYSDYGLITIDDKMITLGETIKFNEIGVHYRGWSKSEEKFRWSIGDSSDILLKLGNSEKISGILKLNIGALGKQEVKVTINDHYIGNKTADSWRENMTFKFDPDILNKNSINIIKFDLPDARKPDNGDTRILAIALRSFTIE